MDSTDSRTCRVELNDAGRCPRVRFPGFRWLWDWQKAAALAPRGQPRNHNTFKPNPKPNHNPYHNLAYTLCSCLGTNVKCWNVVSLPRWKCSFKVPQNGAYVDYLSKCISPLPTVRIKSKTTSKAILSDTPATLQNFAISTKLTCELGHWRFLKVDVNNLKIMKSSQIAWVLLYC